MLLGVHWGMTDGCSQLGHSFHLLFSLSSIPNFCMFLPDISLGGEISWEDGLLENEALLEPFK